MTDVRNGFWCAFIDMEKADQENLFVARDRCEFINRCVLANIAITTATTTILYNVTKLGNDTKQKLKQHRQRQKTTKTKKQVVSTSECLTKSSDSKENNDTQPVIQLKTKNIRLTPKLNRLRPRAAGICAQELAEKTDKSSVKSSSNEKKRKDEKDDDNMKNRPKIKKARRATKK